MSRYSLAVALLLLIAGCTDRPATAGPTTRAAGNDAAPIKLVKTIDLPGVEGRFDHFAADAKGGRLFVAALGNNTLEVIDTAEGKRLKSVGGFRKPTGIAFLPDAARIAIASGDDGMARFFDAGTLAPAGQVAGLDDADNVRYDPAAKRLYVGYGDGALAVIDPTARQKVGEIKLDAHPESFQLEKEGKRIFVNVPGGKHVAVVDREKAAVVAKWAVTQARANFPMALDEPNHRLFIACREPARLLAIDTATGRVVSATPCAGDADDLFYDPARRQIYVSGGEGVITVHQQKTPDEYAPAGSIKTAAGARTSFFVPESSTLYLAVPRRGAQKAELRAFQPARD
jgi:DNA-binding beta-propeller fold protein YncE